MKCCPKSGLYEHGSGAIFIKTGHILTRQLLEEYNVCWSCRIYSELNKSIEVQRRLVVDKRIVGQ
jgi:hypothetical protein